MSWSTKERALAVLSRREFHRPPRPRKVGARIVALLRKSVAALTYPEISERAFITDTATHSALMQLVADGRVVRTGARGAYRYSLPAEHDAPLPAAELPRVASQLQPPSIGVVMLLDQQRKAA